MDYGVPTEPRDLSEDEKLEEKLEGNIWLFNSSLSFIEPGSRLTTRREVVSRWRYRVSPVFPAPRHGRFPLIFQPLSTGW